MPDTRSHRGPRHEDARIFGEAWVPTLREAVRDLSWLQTRGYAEKSALKLVGDRYQLRRRQRVAVLRCACADDALARRRETRVPEEAVRGAEVWLDGFNVLTTVEAALSGGCVLVGRDGCHRDMASMHGSYRKVRETRPAIERVGAVLAGLGVASCRWLLDSPVSNSGRLRGALRDAAEARGWRWEVDLVPDPDPLLAQADAVVATADSVILDGCDRWLNLARRVVEERVSDPWIVDLSSD
ncbi:MAG: DUF434 domain-containing protein [Myxococcota bacterium]